MAKGIGVLSLNLLQNDVRKKEGLKKLIVFSFFALAYIAWSDWKYVLFTLCVWETLKGF